MKRGCGRYDKGVEEICMGREGMRNWRWEKRRRRRRGPGLSEVECDVKLIIFSQVIVLHYSFSC